MLILVHAKKGVRASDYPTEKQPTRKRAFQRARELLKDAAPRDMVTITHDTSGALVRTYRKGYDGVVRFV